MPVQIQPTPNPNAHKYLLPAVHFAAPLNASTPEEAEGHPLAARLFALESVYNVFLVRDFVTVNKRAEVAWEVLDGDVQAIIEEFLDGRIGE